MDFVEHVPDPAVGGKGVRVNVSNVVQRARRGKPVYYLAEADGSEHELIAGRSLARGSFGGIRPLFFRYKKAEDPHLVLKTFERDDEYQQQFGAMSIAENLRGCDLVAFKAFSVARNGALRMEVILERADVTALELVAKEPSRHLDTFVNFIGTLNDCFDFYNESESGAANGLAFATDIKLANIGVIDGNTFRLIDLDGLSFFPGTFSCLYPLSNYAFANQEERNIVMQIESKFALAAVLCEWIGHSSLPGPAVDVAALGFDRTDFSPVAQRWTRGRPELANQLRELLMKVYLQRKLILKSVVAQIERVPPNGLAAENKTKCVIVLQNGITAVGMAENFVDLCVSELIRNASA